MWAIATRYEGSKGDCTAGACLKLMEVYSSILNKTADLLAGIHVSLDVTDYGMVILVIKYIHIGWVNTLIG